MKRLGWRHLAVGLIGIWAWVCPVQAAPPGPQQPLAWLGVRSFQRFEQRLIETAQLTRMPGIAQLILGFLNLQWGSFQGLDRQRPIGMVLPTLAPAGNPPVIMAIPYSHKNTMWATLQQLFPESTIASDYLSLRGNFGHRFGRFDEDAKLLLIAREISFLHDMEITLPQEWFDKHAGPETDIVLRIDVAAVKTRHPAEWHAFLDQMMQDWRKARAAALADTRTEADRAFVTVVFDLLKQRQDQAMSDLQQAEGRIMLSSDGWVAEVEGWVQPDSAMAAFLKLQTVSAVPVPLLFSDDASIRILASMRQPEAWQQDTRTLIAHWQRAAESHLTGRPDWTPERRSAHLTGIRAGADVMMRSLAESFLYVAAEAKPRPLAKSGQSSEMTLTGWLQMKEGRSHLEALLDQVAPIYRTEAQPVQLMRNVARHRGIPLHRLILSRDKMPPASQLVVNHLFVAADGPMLAWHAGASLTPLTQWLDRWRTRSPTVSREYTALLRIEAPVSLMLDLAWSADGTPAESDLESRVVQRLRQVHAPIQMEMTPRSNAARTRWPPSVNGLSTTDPMISVSPTSEPVAVPSVRLRTVIPRALLQSIADVLGQELLQTLVKPLLRR